MLIVCPNCATSYLIEPTSVGSAGRTVRCARCKTTWFAAAPKPVNDVTAFVDGVIAEAEAQTGGLAGGQPNEQFRPPSPPQDVTAAADDFGGEPLAFPAATGLPEAASGPLGLTSHDDFTAHDQPAPFAADAPSLVPRMDHAPSPGADSAALDGEDMDSFAARRQRLKAKRQTKKRSSRWTAIALVLFAFNVALVGARSEVVRFLPQTASLFAAIGLPVNLRNLKFENVRISRETADGVTALLVEGTIVGTTSKAAEVPRLRFAARNAAGQEVYTWTAQPARSVLGPDENLPFTSRLVTPPPDAVDVVVRFFTAQDAAAGAK
jgi:predicted Zn finger-like uncharacterized protein